MSKKLIRSGWHDEYESFIYFQIVDDNNSIWSSSWYDIRDFIESKATINSLRNEVHYACKQHSIAVNLDSDDFFDWIDWK